MDITFKHNEGKLELKAPFQSVFVPPTIEKLNITANGTYEAPEGVDGYSPITVDVIPEGVPTDEELTISGDCSYRFYGDNWTWFLEKYKDRLVFNNITNAADMFSRSPSIESLDFDIIFDDSQSHIKAINMFSYCDNLKNIRKIVNLKGREIGSMFWGCKRLRYLPQFENFSFINYDYAELQNFFCYCYSLRSIPEEFLKKLSITASGGYTGYSLGYNGFYDCKSLDEIKGINIRRSNITSNLFYHTFDYCGRVKNIIFAKEDNGSPYTATWKSQYINLASNVGYAGVEDFIIGWNSGITSDKKVIDDTTYQALKNDPDWFTLKKEYSRYNHDSAVATINSLPDTSAYLAEKGGTNTIKFIGDAGSATDGGAINTLTEEEIAVATAKGWTITFV
nr:hypothetical protein JMPHXYHW_JMPHXYHW_CDS_0033 [uncultured phage]